MNTMDTQDMTSNSTRTLDTLKSGERAIIQRLVCTNRLLRNKLLSMGLVLGTAIEVTAVAPLGDPINIKLLRSQLSLRLSEAREIIVSICS